MGGISDNLEEFRKITRKHYGKLVNSLEEKYCWKCPMHTTSSETFCREAEIWLRLSNAFEQGIHDELISRNIPKDSLEVIAAKLLEKKMKVEVKTPKFQKLILLKVGEDLDLQVKEGSFLLVKENPKSVKKDDLVLLPRVCPLSLGWFSRASYMNMPLKLFKVARSFQKGNITYMKTESGLEIPVVYVFGVVLKIIMEKDPIYSDLGLKQA
jgi:hypothetical protein